MESHLEYFSSLKVATVDMPVPIMDPDQCGLGRACSKVIHVGKGG